MPLIDTVRNYYEDKLRTHGATPKGVDWNGEASQWTRFEALGRVYNTQPADAVFSLDDYGCGYGAYVDFLKASGRGTVDYLGIDVSPEMVTEARKLHPAASFEVGTRSSRKADYAVASGIFNVALEVNREEWESYILGTLDTLHETTEHGFSFNCLTSYSDVEFMRPHLYYGNPGFFFDHCKRRYSKNVALLHDYGLYEFTILVRKTL